MIRFSFIHIMCVFRHDLSLHREEKPFLLGVTSACLEALGPLAGIDTAAVSHRSQDVGVCRVEDEI